MQRFYFNSSLGEKLAIDDKDFFHQISHVLRARSGDEIVLFNGDSFEYFYKISDITKKGITLDFIKKIKNKADSEKIINLYQAIPNKYEKIEYILQKGVEIGISNFIFFNSYRSQKLVIGDKKLERFKHITKESLEQCGGNKFPNISFINKLDLTKISGKKIILHTEEIKNTFLSSGANTRESDVEVEGSFEIINLFVGPEGGWSDKEINDFSKNSGEIINFGFRVLRTETAGIVVGFNLLNN